jgi:hypothetical protein
MLMPGSPKGIFGIHAAETRFSPVSLGMVTAAKRGLHPPMGPLDCGRPGLIEPFQGVQGTGNLAFIQHTIVIHIQSLEQRRRREVSGRTTLLASS